jgi:hypothetical protein
MWANFWAATYWADTYWPKVGAVYVPPTTVTGIIDPVYIHDQKGIAWGLDPRTRRPVIAKRSMISRFRRRFGR